jgi:hypothetical protein
VAHVYNLSTQETEAGGLECKFEASLSYVVRPFREREGGREREREREREKEREREGRERERERERRESSTNISIAFLYECLSLRPQGFI